VIAVVVILVSIMGSRQLKPKVEKFADYGTSFLENFNREKSGVSLSEEWSYLEPITFNFIFLRQEEDSSDMGTLRFSDFNYAGKDFSKKLGNKYPGGSSGKGCWIFSFENEGLDEEASYLYIPSMHHDKFDLSCLGITDGQVKENCKAEGGDKCNRHALPPIKEFLNCKFEIPGDSSFELDGQYLCGALSPNYFQWFECNAVFYGETIEVIPFELSASVFYTCTIGDKWIKDTNYVLVP